MASKKNKGKKGSGRNNNDLKSSQSNPSNSVAAATQSPKGSQSFTPPSDLGGLTLSITMLSDWHIGVGAGRSGDIDSLVVRDRTGLPYIPAKTLTGLWRDACETVAWGLDDASLGTWSAWVEFLFGDQPGPNTDNPAKVPRPAAIAIGPATFDPALVAAVQAKPALQEAISFVKPGVGIDPHTGCAKENFLRFEEMVRGGATLTARCEALTPLWHDLDNAQQATAQALLLAATKLIERVGGKRRRGAGRCEVALHLNSAPLNLDACLKQLSQPPAPLPEAISTHPLMWQQSGAANAATTEWLSIPLTLTAQSPLVLAKATVGNVVQSLDYIPGSRLLPLISKRLGRQALAFAIGHGQLVITNALPVANHQRSLPVPFALFGEKLRGGLASPTGVVYNRLVEPEPTRQLKGERGGYIVPSSQHLPDYVAVPTSVFTHNTIEDAVQRPTTDVGGVYSYEAIQSGMTFQAELRLPSSLAASLDFTRLEGAYSLGRSKKDEYGRVQISVGTQQVLDTTRDTGPQQTLTVWLLSDLLLRDVRLRPTTNLDVLAQTLGKTLGCSLQLRDEPGVMSVLARDSRTESWQATWGLPRPSLVGLAAGSCFVFTVNSAVSAAALAQLEITGLGERTAEGFGQLCLNHPLLTQKTSTLPQREVMATTAETTAPLLNGNVTSQTKAYAHIIEQAAWRRELRQRVLATVATAQGRKTVLGISNTSPNLTQLGALRSVIGRLTAVEDSTTSGGVTGWLTHLERVPNRRDKWPSEAREQIRVLVSNPEEVWRVLGFTPEVEHQLCLTPNGATKQKRALWAEAVRTLVDGCIRSRRREGEQ